jgi:hypothetical protein
MNTNGESEYFRMRGDITDAQFLFEYALPRGSWLKSFHERDWLQPWTLDWKAPDLMPDDGTEHKCIYDIIGSTLIPAFSTLAREVLEPYLPKRSEWLPFRYEQATYWGLHVFEVLLVQRMDPSRSSGLRQPGSMLLDYQSLHLCEDHRSPIPEIVSLRPAPKNRLYVSPRVRLAIESANLTGFIFDAPITVEWALQ